MKKLLLVIYLTLISCSQKDNSELEWTKNGTLHKKMIIEWKKASDENKLATCADFIVGLKQTDNERYTSVETMKLDAINLKTCIEEGTKNNNYADNMQIVEVASACYILMKSQ